MITNHDDLAVGIIGSYSIEKELGIEERKLGPLHFSVA